jgi:hypothetical protein
MRNSTLLYLSLAALALYLLGRFFLLDAAAQSHNGLLALLALLVYPLATALLTLVAWAIGLIKTAKRRQWGWFVAIFCLPILGTLLYGLLGPKDQPAPLPVTKGTQR